MGQPSFSAGIEDMFSLNPGRKKEGKKEEWWKEKERGNEGKKEGRWKERREEWKEKEGRKKERVEESTWFPKCSQKWSLNSEAGIRLEYLGCFIPKWHHCVSLKWGRVVPRARAAEELTSDRCDHQCTLYGGGGGDSIGEPISTANVCGALRWLWHDSRGRQMTKQTEALWDRQGQAPLLHTFTPIAFKSRSPQKGLSGWAHSYPVGSGHCVPCGLFQEQQPSWVSRHRPPFRSGPSAWHMASQSKRTTRSNELGFSL